MKKREYDNPFTNPKVKAYFKGKTVEVRSQETINAEWVAVMIASGMVVGGCLVLLLGLAWWFI